MKALFLGGDQRQKYAYEYMKAMDICCKIYMKFTIDRGIIEETESADVVVLPLPITKDGTNLNLQVSEKISLNDILEIIPQKVLILGGNIPMDFLNLAKSKGNIIMDYYENESFQISNALLSAEGAIYYSMDRITGSIYGSRIAILGFGRIGKILAHMLKSQGAHVTIFARKNLDRAWGDIIGYDTVRISEDSINKPQGETFDYDIVFNTIPKQVMNEDFIKSISTKTVIIDLASYPYGADKALIDKYKLNYYYESGIPGRYAPQSAGNIIGKTIINILKQENYL